MDNKTKNITRNNYNRPKQTFQEKLSNTEIKEKLKDYKKVSNIKNVSIGTHLRYFSVDSQTGNKQFRLGGNLNKVDPEGRYVILSNGTVNWSVQIPDTIFFQKMSEDEYKEELKREIKKEIQQSESHVDEDDFNKLKKMFTNLSKKYEDLESEYKEAVKKNTALNSQLKSIEKEIMKQKSKK
jgi:hypothetical protein